MESYADTIKAWHEARKAGMLAMRTEGASNRAIATKYECSTQWVNKMIGPEGKRKKKRGTKSKKIRRNGPVGT